ncbi:MAG: PKD domain-containing protein, partial [Cyclobacteriaceae bacterium]|nr:PKD domain-containing protein [Cyclobacteriaceae bacterium]
NPPPYFHHPPPIDFEITVGCLNQPTFIKDISSTIDGNSINSWYWEIDDQIYISQHVEHIFSTSGIHDVTLTVTPKNNCAISISKEIFIEASPIVDFSMENVCDNEFTIFKGVSIIDLSAIVSRTWDFG